MWRNLWNWTLIGALGACSARSADTMTTEQNKQAVRRIYEDYINQNRRELLPELVSADYASPDGRRGPEAFASVVEGLRKGIPDIRFDVEDLIGDGNRVTIRWKWSGTHRGTFNGLAPSNRHVQNEGIAIYELEGGKVTRSWLQTDRLGFLQQIGLVSPELGKPPGQR